MGRVHDNSSINQAHTHTHNLIHGAGGLLRGWFGGQKYAFSADRRTEAGGERREAISSSEGLPLACVEPS